MLRGPYQRRRRTLLGRLRRVSLNGWLWAAASIAAAIVIALYFA
jgi:hypothetical protein